MRGVFFFFKSFVSIINTHSTGTFWLENVLLAFAPTVLFWLNASTTGIVRPDI